MRKTRLYRTLIVLFFLLAVCLRLLLYAANPPDNSFDDHYEPIDLLRETGAIPAKDACWECFQPPVFYLLSAAMAKNYPGFAASDPLRQLKLLQFLPALYGILTVFVIYLILNRIEISDFARILSFGLVCFLPRHIYMSAMHTNDTLAYLMVSLAVYIMIVAIDQRLFFTSRGSSGEDPYRHDETIWQRSPLKAILLSSALLAVTLLALGTKSTALVLLPMIAAIFLFAYWQRLAIIDLKSLALMALLLFIPLLAVGGAAISDLKTYGEPLPLNVDLLQVTLRQPPGRDGLSFFDFKPWATVTSPVLAPENVGSFWTLIYSRMWFDMEPKFLPFTDPNPDWWGAYDDYLNRHDTHDWPGKLPLSRLTWFTGATLITLGMVPLILILIGLARTLWGRWALWSAISPQEMVKAQLMLIVLLVNIVGILFHVYRHPYYSFMKAAFLLNALPALAVFLAFGIMLGEKHNTFRWGISLVFGVLFLLTTVHVVHIAQALAFGMLPGSAQIERALAIF